MARYLLIESRDPFESKDVDYFYDLATGLKSRGNEVTLFLVQNGVLPTRKCAATEALTALSDAGVQILADTLSLQERGMDKLKLGGGAKAAEIDVIVDQLGDGVKTMWH